MYTCKHICLCLYSFVYVLSFVKQQILKNSETVSIVALGRATDYQAGRHSVLRLCDCSHTHPLLMTVYQALRSLQSFLQARLYSVEYTPLCKLQGSTDRGPWCSHPGEAAIKPSLLRMTRNFPSPCFSVLICKCRAYSPGSSLFQ